MPADTKWALNCFPGGRMGERPGDLVSHKTEESELRVIGVSGPNLEPATTELLRK